MQLPVIDWLSIPVAGLGTAEIIALPTAIAGLLAIVSYAAGGIRPVRVKASYWLNEAGAELICIVKNRRWKGTRSLTGLGLISVPPLHKRRPGWRGKGGLQSSPFLLQGPQLGAIRDGGVPIESLDRITIRCTILAPDGSPPEADFRLPDELRVQASFGDSRSALGRPRFKSTQPSAK